jgi:hypothetical protein
VGCDGVGGLGQSGKGLVSGVDDGGNSYSGPAAAPVGIGLDVVGGLVVVDEGRRNRYEARPPWRLRHLVDCLSGQPDNCRHVVEGRFVELAGIEHSLKRGDVLGASFDFTN